MCLELLRLDLDELSGGKFGGEKLELLRLDLDELSGGKFGGE
ncbi:hypothetical protein CLOP_g17346, partial [Closterium sp. NIES-67]